MTLNGCTKNAPRPFVVDKNVFYQDEKGKNIDQTTLEYFEHYPYFKDKNNVYVKIGNAKGESFVATVQDADKKSFKTLDRGYARDNRNVFFYDKKISGADLDTFQVLYSGYIDPGDFDYGYSKDVNHIYFNNEIIEGADPITFKIVGGNYVKDKSHVYFFDGISFSPKKMPQVDAESFIQSGVRFEDKNYIYRGALPIVKKIKFLDLSKISQNKICRIEEGDDFKFFFFASNVEGEIVPEQFIFQNKQSNNYYLLASGHVWDATYDKDKKSIFLGLRHILFSNNNFKKSKESLARDIDVSPEELEKHTWEANNMCGGCPTYSTIAKLNVNNFSLEETGYFGGEEVKIKDNKLFFTQYTNNNSFKEIYNCWVGIFSSSKDCDHLNIPAFEMDLKTQKINKKFTTKKIGEIKNIKQDFISCDLKGFKKENQ